jgi:hypothetical protein
MKGKAPADSGTRGLQWEHTGVWDGFCAPQYTPPPHSTWYYPQQFSSPLAVTWIPTIPPLPPPPVQYPACHRCGASWPDHPFDLCPIDARCLYCVGGHLSCHCPWPHILYTTTNCFCPDDHDFAGRGLQPNLAVPHVPHSASPSLRRWWHSALKKGGTVIVWHVISLCTCQCDHGYLFALFQDSLQYGSLDLSKVSP